MQRLVADVIAKVVGWSFRSWSGETFLLSTQPIWVQPIAVALALAAQQVEKKQIERPV